MGGEIAAPVFAEVVTEALQILGVPPEGITEIDLMASGIRRYEFLPEIVEEETDLDAASGLDENESPDEVAGEREAASNDDGEVAVPDLAGRSLREAVAMIAARGLKIKASGDGLVMSQSPPPGTYVARDAVCVVRLSKQAKARKPRRAMNSPPKAPRRAALGLK
jgi:hypothetical protein